jgi:hypothetical protein
MTKLERQFVREVGDIFDRRYEMSFEDLVRAFKTVETHYVELETKPFLILETKRRVAEWMIMAATDKRCPYETCRARLDHLFQLGFTDLQMKVTMCIIFARYCRATRHFREGIELLEPVVEELQSELIRAGITRHEKEFYGDLINNTEVVLNKLRQSMNPTA